MKEKIKFYGILAVGLLISGYFLTFKINKKSLESTRCGVVWDRAMPTTIDVHKHSADVEISQYLYVKYDDNQRIESENVDANTYYTYEKGDRVCFTSSRRLEFYEVMFGPMLGAICLLVLLFRILWDYC